MTTAQAIEAMTDAGEFEILATRVLRIEEEDCRRVEHTGVNAEGKPIPNPVDGFCQVGGTSPRRYVMTAFTTARKADLRRKWLFDHRQATGASQSSPADDGDLVKAARKAEEIRRRQPNAVCRVYLCTNKLLDDGLMAEVYDAAAQLESKWCSLANLGSETALT